MKDTIKLYFDDKSEHRGWYLERYSPPYPGGFFAVHTITVLDDSPAEEIITEMEARAAKWYKDYQVPVFTMASRQDASSTGIKSIKGHEALTVFSNAKGQPIEYFWESMADDRFPRDSYSNGELLSIYNDFGMRTSAELKRENESKTKSLKYFIWMYRFAFIVVPAIWLVYQELFSPAIFPIMIMVYGLLKYGRELLISLGCMKRTKREIEKAEKERKIEHYAYHCEQNPGGFEKLRSENNKRYLEGRRKEREKELLVSKSADET